MAGLARGQLLRGHLLLPVEHTLVLRILHGPGRHRLGLRLRLGLHILLRHRLPGRVLLLLLLFDDLLLLLPEDLLLLLPGHLLLFRAGPFLPLLLPAGARLSRDHVTDP